MYWGSGGIAYAASCSTGSYVYKERLPKEQDPERGLSGEGIAEATRIAGVAATYHVAANKILHSGKKRARQTAEIFAKALEPEAGVEATDGLAPLDDVTAMAGRIDDRDNVMLVGHMPFMSRLASYLVTGKIDPAVFLFQNGGIVCLTRIADKGSWAIKWALMPTVD